MRKAKKKRCERSSKKMEKIIMNESSHYSKRRNPKSHKNNKRGRFLANYGS
jgi:hypothetical protein